MGDRGLELTPDSSRFVSGREHAVSALLAIGGGLAWSLCFEAEERGWLAWVALVPLVLLLERRHAVRWAMAFGVVYWLAAMPWIITTLASFGGLPTGLARVLFVALAFYLALDIVLFAWVGRFMLRAFPAWGWLGLPALWVSTEALRGLFFDGFPWNLAAYAWIDVPGALELTSWIGATGVSFLVVAANVAVARIVTGVAAAAARGWQRPSTAADVLSGAQLSAAQLSGVMLAGVAVLLTAGATAPEPGLGASSGTVRVVQPNSDIVFDAASAWQQYRQLIGMSHAACDGDSLLVWPESAAWPEDWRSSQVLRDDVRTLVERGCPVLLGSTLPTDGGTLNAAFVVSGPDPTLLSADNGSNADPGLHMSAPYGKRQLVPWGEYVPLAELPLVGTWVGKLARNAGDFVPGRDVALLSWRDQKLGLAICYEVMFSTPVAEQVRAGATTLVTLTNDAWYGDSSAPHQHLRGARFRAAENRRPMVRAALTGISASIGPRGELLSSLGVGEQGVLEIDLRPGTDSTLYSRAPLSPLIVCVFMTVLFLGFAIIRTRRRQGSDAR